MEYSRSLGEVSTKLINELTRKNLNIFSIEDAANILNKEKTRVRKLLYDLTKRGWIQRVKENLYILLPISADAGKLFTEHQLIIASKLISPYYIGFWTMLNYYGYTEQLINTVFIASPKQKRELSIQGVVYKFITLPEYKMFGFEQISLDSKPILVSDKEKTIVDCLDHPEYCGGIIEASKGIWNAQKEIDFIKLLEYCKKIRNSTVSKRLGFILETINNKDKDLLGELEKLVKQGFSVLDPLLPKKGRYITKWNLLVNISENDLWTWRKT